MSRRKNPGQQLAAMAALSAMLLVLASCEGSESKAAGNSASNANNAELFTIPQDQMSHVQVLTVQPTTLTRSLRLTGAVAYNGFRTTPVITQVSGPVSRVVVVPGQKVAQGEPMLYVASPDYSQLRTNYLKAKSAYSLAQMAFARAQDLYQHHAIAEQNLEQAEAAEVQANGDLVAAQAALKVMGVTDPDALVKAPPSFEVPVKAPIGGLVVEQDVSAGQIGAGDADLGATQAGSSARRDRRQCRHQHRWSGARVHEGLRVARPPERGDGHADCGGTRW